MDEHCGEMEGGEVTLQRRQLDEATGSECMFIQKNILFTLYEEY